MKKSTSPAAKMISLAIAAIALLIGAAYDGHAQRTRSYGNVWISDFDSAGALLSVVSDGPGATESNLYKDYRLPNGDPCVSAFGSPTFIMYPDRGGCAPQRHFRLYFPVEATDDADFPVACKTTFDDQRGQYYANAWRMYFSNLFGTTSRKTPVVKTDARFGFYCDGTAYSVQPDQELVPAIDSTNNKRRLKNTGEAAVKASLLKPQDGSFVRLNIDSFPFTFDISAQLTSQ